MLKQCGEKLLYLFCLWKIVAGMLSTSCVGGHRKFNVNSIFEHIVSVQTWFTDVLSEPDTIQTEIIKAISSFYMFKIKLKPIKDP